MRVFFQDNGETKTVTEFQFFIRTSANVMSATAEFVDFLMAVRSFREYLKKFNAPLLVHCRLMFMCVLCMMYLNTYGVPLHCPTGLCRLFAIQFMTFFLNFCVCVNSMQQRDESFYFFKRWKWPYRSFYRS